ncbi:hypothetical protein SEPCBS119000_000090 [Sporothrix epigloea]|uniref:Uncharacterized protein n=1 Tax=Sporothrix epigloea TaxID=1892477 RepID=A0ABP0D6D6_9PEZI
MSPKQQPTAKPNVRPAAKMGSSAYAVEDQENGEKEEEEEEENACDESDQSHLLLNQQ